MQKDKAKSEKVGCAPHTIARIASFREGYGLSPRPATPPVALRTDGTPSSRPDVSTAPRRAAALRAEAARHDKPCPRAFTLVELLVVIAVIALLMAIFLPALQGAKKRAHAVKCQGTLRQWGVYYAMYTSEYDYRMPPVEHLTLSIPGVLPLAFYAGRHTTKEGGVILYDDLHVYEKLLVCPGTRSPPASDPYTVLPWNGDTYKAYDRGAFRGSYGTNGFMPLGRYPEKPEDYYTGSLPNPHPRIPQGVWVSCLVKGAARVPVYSDCRWDTAWPKSTDPPPPCADAPYGSPDGPPSEYVWLQDPGRAYMWLFAMDRHQGGINSLFMDWSVRKAGVKELWTLKWSPGFDTAGRWTKAGGVQPDQWPPWMQKFKDY